MRQIALFGSTGSIGRQTLDIVRCHKDLKVTVLTARSSVSLMEEQIREFRPSLAVMTDEKAAKDLKERVSDLPDIHILGGEEALVDAAVHPSYSQAVMALVGMVGVSPSLAAVEAGKDLLLANKETLVTAGHLLIPAIRRKGSLLLPIDSEHSAIFQCLSQGMDRGLKRLILTASGGPFRGRKREELRGVTRADALKHPNWTMGAKITIDSATLFNKGLEIMEAHWLFGVPYDKIDAVVHPESIIHSMVEYVDGAVLAQLGTPDMRLPIQYALYYPERRDFGGDHLDFLHMKALHFEAIDTETFGAVRLAYEAGRKGGNLPTVLNAANEAAVSLFLEEKIPFLAIEELVEGAMRSLPYVENPSLPQILDTEREARSFVQKEVAKI